MWRAGSARCRVRPGKEHWDEARSTRGRGTLPAKLGGGQRKGRKREATARRPTHVQLRQRRALVLQHKPRPSPHQARPPSLAILLFCASLALPDLPLEHLQIARLGRQRGLLDLSARTLGVCTSARTLAVCTSVCRHQGRIHVGAHVERRVFLPGAQGRDTPALVLPRRFSRVYAHLQAFKAGGYLLCRPARSAPCVFPLLVFYAHSDVCVRGRGVRDAGATRLSKYHIGIL
jgi:hypothetical protein